MNRLLHNNLGVMNILFANRKREGTEKTNSCFIKYSTFGLLKVLFFPNTLSEQTVGKAWV